MKIGNSNFANTNEPSTDSLHSWDRQHQLHPWAAMDAWREYDHMLVENAEGIYLWDASGKKFIDGPGGMWCVQIGYGRQEMADAIAKQAMKLPYASPWTTVTEPSSILAKKIAELAPGDLNNVFFTTGGSTAVDTAIRTMHFMNNRLGRQDKKIVLATTTRNPGKRFFRSIEKLLKIGKEFKSHHIVIVESDSKKNQTKS